MVGHTADSNRRIGAQDRMMRWALDRARRKGTHRRWRSLGRRRALVVVQAVAGLLLIAGFLVPPPLAFVLLFGMLLPFVFLSSRLNLVSGMLSEMGSRWLDERELTEQMRARNISHRVVLWVLLVSVFTTGFVTGGDLRADVLEITPGMFLAFLLLLFFLHTSVPAAYIAWTRSEESFEAEDEEAVDPGAG